MKKTNKTKINKKYPKFFGGGTYVGEDGITYDAATNKPIGNKNVAGNVIGVAAGVGSMAVNALADDGPETRGSAVGGGIAKGALSGAAAGASIGSLIPGWGTAVGGAVGAVVGGVSGGISGNNDFKAAENARNTKEAIALNDRIINEGMKNNPFGGQQVQTFRKGGVKMYSNGGIGVQNAFVDHNEVIKEPNSGNIDRVKGNPNKTDSIKASLQEGSMILSDEEVLPTNKSFAKTARKFDKIQKQSDYVLNNKKSTELEKETALLNKNNIDLQFNKLMAIQEDQKIKKQLNEAGYKNSGEYIAKQIFKRGGVYPKYFKGKGPYDQLTAAKSLNLTPAQFEEASSEFYNGDRSTGIGYDGRPVDLNYESYQNLKNKIISGEDTWDASKGNPNQYNTIQNYYNYFNKNTNPKQMPIFGSDMQLRGSLLPGSNVNNKTATELDNTQRSGAYPLLKPDINEEDDYTGFSESQTAYAKKWNASDPATRGTFKWPKEENKTATSDIKQRINNERPGYYNGNQILDYLPALYNLGTGIFDKAEQLNSRDYETQQKIGWSPYNEKPELRQNKYNSIISRYNNARRNTNTGADMAFGIEANVRRGLEDSAVYAKKYNIDSQAKQAADVANLQTDARNKETRFKVDMTNFANQAKKRDYLAKGVSQVSEANQRNRVDVNAYNKDLYQAKVWDATNRRYVTKEEADAIQYKAKGGVYKKNIKKR